MAPWLALVVIAVQAVPFGTSLLGALGHSAFHLAERMARVQALHMARQLEGLSQVTLGYEHSHGPGEELHEHVLPVDLALRFVAVESEDPDRPGVRTAPQVDQHVPAREDPGTRTPLVAVRAVWLPIPDRSIPPAPPPVPPPQA
jgi:hypothetical protein